VAKSIRNYGFASRIALIWVGICVGGNLIATMAKFQVASLPLTSALEVGRATFHSIGIAEAILCGALIPSFFLDSGKRRAVAIIPIIIFAIQWLVVMPVIDARTLAIIAREPVSGSSIHLMYIALEMAKIFLLLGIGLLKHE
jgi:hypothetical protein